MATFLTGNRLNTALEHLFECAESHLMLISPYIRLHDRYASVLRTKKDNADLKIIVVFGKNEDDLSRSMKQEDFLFFKEFPNIEIRFEKRLHAKYYANEHAAILSSMNLYNFSQDNNIEAGVHISRKGLIGNLTDSLTGNVSLEDDAAYYFERVRQQSELLFQRVPKFESKLLLGKRYINSVVEVDKLSDFFSNKKNFEESFKKESFSAASKEAYKNISESNPTGYCIRTGVPIHFNQYHPMCDSSYRNWEKFRNEEYEENYCHFSGEPSNGATSFARPILRKNWAKAKELYNL